MASPRTQASDAPARHVEDPAGEHRVLTEACGLFDRSDRGKLALTGPGAVEFLNGQVTNELDGLRAGEGCYAAFLTHKGKMLGDLRIVAVAEHEGRDADDGTSPPLELLLDTERVALQALFDMIRRFKVGYHLELHKRTLERGLLSLIGPEAGAILDVELPALARLGTDEHANRRVRIDGITALAVRTDIGIDLLCEAADSDALRAALSARGAVIISEQATEVVRVERGRPRFGIDLDDTVIPQEAGLNERAVSFTKGCYVGQETVARLFYKGKPNRHLRGLRLSEPAAAGERLVLGERTVGHLGSTVISPTHGPIALALVRREAEPGSAVAVGEGAATARVLELPFPAS